MYGVRGEMLLLGPIFEEKGRRSSIGKSGGLTVRRYIFVFVKIIAFSTLTESGV